MNQSYTIPWGEFVMIYIQFVYSVGVTRQTIKLFLEETLS